MHLRAWTLIALLFPGGINSTICAEVTSKTPLFNGRDLEGFYTWLLDIRHEDPRQVFTVTNGMIRISGEGLGYLATKGNYSNFHLVAEFKWGTRNYHWGDRIGRAKDSGLFLHATGPDGNSHDGKGAFMAAIECNIFQGATGDFLLIRGDDADGTLIAPRITAETRSVKDAEGWHTYRKGGQMATIQRWGRLNWKSKSENWKDLENFRGARDVENAPGEWNTLECIAAGSRIIVFLNGVLVNQAEDVWPNKGKILLQCEGSEIFFRRLELLPLRNELSDAPAAGTKIRLSSGDLFIPNLLPERKTVPLLIHLHGHGETAQKNLTRADFPGVLLTVNRPGLSAAYASFFQTTNVFWELLDEANKVLQKENTSRTIDKIYVSSFSAGFGGVRELLKDADIFRRIDGLVMADSIYCSFENNATRDVDSVKMAGFLEFARAASEGKKWMLVSHSQQPVPDYASTTETANYLLQKLELPREEMTRRAQGSLEQISAAQKGNFIVKGFEGTGPEDHMQHLRGIWLFWEELSRKESLEN